MKPIEEESYQMYILRKISRHDITPDFPKLDDFGITKSEMEDYLSEKQDVMDIPGTQTHRMTVFAGIILVSMLIFSAFDHIDTALGTNASSIGMVVGVVLSCIWFFIVKFRVNSKLKALYNENVEHYLEAVENY